MGKLWDLCNKETAGQLNRTELFAILALIAITQNNVTITSLSCLLKFSEAPIPNLGQTNPNDSKQNLQETTNTNIPSDSTNVSENFQTQPFVDDFADFQAAPTSTSANFANFASFPTLSTEPSSNSDLTNNSRGLTTFENFGSVNNNSTLNKTENNADDNDDFDDFCSVQPSSDSNSKVQSLDKLKSLISESTYVCPDNNMKSTSSASDTVTNDTSRSFSGSSDMFSMSSHSDSGAVSSANSEDWSDGVVLPPTKPKHKEETDFKKSTFFPSKMIEKPVVIGTGLNPYDTTPPEMNDYADGDNDEEFYQTPGHLYDLDDDCGLDDAHNSGSSMYNDKSKNKIKGSSLKSNDRIQDAQSVSSLDLPASKHSDTKSISSLELKHSVTSDCLQQTSNGKTQCVIFLQFIIFNYSELVHSEIMPKSRSAQDVLQEDVSPVADRYRDLRKSPIEEVRKIILMQIVM